MKNRECKICNCELTKKQKQYCSRECQYKGYKKQKVQRVDLQCIFCNKNFLTKESNLKVKGRGQYCSRKCKDLHQKEKYVGSNNPMYGITHTRDWLENQKNIITNLWKSEIHRKKVKESMDRFVKENGYYPGQDKNSRDKAKNTLFERYGVYHNWSGIFGNRKCDKTFIENHNGITSHEYRSEILRNNKKSKPEYTFENFLIELQISYIFQFKVKNRFFDFYLPDYNTIVEIDGDYFHGRGLSYDSMNLQQKRSYKNDKYKNSIIKKLDFRFIRIWESDLYKMNLENIKTVICQK